MTRNLATLFCLAVASLFAGGPLEAQKEPPQVVSVELSSFRFTPHSLIFEHGRTYRLHLANTSGGGHDFTAPEFFASSVIAPDDRSEVVGGKVRLSGKQSLDVVLTPEKPGTYELHCSHFLHSGMGMKGEITVQ